jgi:hypothetical protein
MATLNFKGYSVEVYVINGEFPDSDVVSIDLGNFEKPYAANFENGEKLYFNFFSYEDSILFRDDVNVDKYKAAIAAENALIAAKLAYRNTMKSLGAIQEERGNYEDYQTWLEIPGIPDKKWSDE